MTDSEPPPTPGPPDPVPVWPEYDELPDALRSWLSDEPVVTTFSQQRREQGQTFV